MSSSAGGGDASASPVSSRESDLRRELQRGLSCLCVGLVMLAIFLLLALYLIPGGTTSSGAVGALLVGYWLLGPAGVILSVLGAILSLVNWISLQRP